MSDQDSLVKRLKDWRGDPDHWPNDIIALDEGIVEYKIPPLVADALVAAVEALQAADLIEPYEPYGPAWDEYLEAHNRAYDLLKTLLEGW